MHSWEDKLIEGVEVEASLAKLFGSVFSRSSKLYDEYAGDMRIESSSIEVKAEHYPEVNFFFEYAEAGVNRRSGHLRSEADTYLHWFVPANVGYLLAGPDLRDWIEKNWLHYDEKVITSQDSRGETWEVVGMAVPIGDVIRDVPYIRFTGEW